jgi:hypothetical protein
MHGCLIFSPEIEVNCMQMQTAGKSSFERNFKMRTRILFCTAITLSLSPATSTFSTADVARLKYLCADIFSGVISIDPHSVCGSKPRVVHKKRECCAPGEVYSSYTASGNTRIRTPHATFINVQTLAAWLSAVRKYVDAS